MKIVIYNWTPIDDPRGRGGGVSVYLRNFIPKLIEGGHEVIFLNSGRYYDLFRRSIHLREINNIFTRDGMKSFEIINSPIKAPARDSFFRIESCLNNEEAANFFVRTIMSFGDVDQIHFHNFEGISTRALLDLKKMVHAKIVVWLHNYHMVCPQMELLNQNKRVCLDFDSGRECVICLGEKISMKRKIGSQRVVSFIERWPKPFDIFSNQIIRLLLWGWQTASKGAESLKSSFRRSERGMRTHATTNGSVAEGYLMWRNENIKRLNQTLDVCFAVSKQVAEAYQAFGLRKELIEVTPLGMDIYDSRFKELGMQRSASRKGLLKIAFVGYATRAKGFDLFVDALGKLRACTRRSFTTKLVAKANTAQLEKIEEILGELEFLAVNGYSRVELSAVYQEVDIVVVPSIWMETFNQVAYEATMMGVPVVISDSVGIGEYLPSNFKFKSNDSSDLARVLTEILEQPELIEKYWRSDEFNLFSDEEHYSHVIKALIQLDS